MLTFIKDNSDPDNNNHTQAADIPADLADPD
jgi:hypothetical protein